MPFSKENEEKLRQLTLEAEREWEAMSEAEREEVRKIAIGFEKKVASCYPDDKPKKKRKK